MLNKEVVLKAINERECGVMPNFSEIELNQAVDLVLFKNFEVDSVCQMDGETLDRLSNDEEDFNDSLEWYICPCCGEKVSISYDGEREEAYIGFCECGQHYFVSCYGMDNYCEYLEELGQEETFDEHEYIQDSINHYYNTHIKKAVKEVEKKRGSNNKVR